MRIKKYLKSTLVIIIFTAVITTFFNYLLFISQFNKEKNDKIFHIKYELFKDANSYYMDIILNENDMTLLDYKFDLKYEKWQDSLKLKVLPLEIHEKLKRELYQDNQNLLENSKKYKLAQLNFSRIMLSSALFYRSENLFNSLDSLEKVSGTKTRRNVYESFRNKIINKNTSKGFKGLNPYRLEDSMTLFYSHKIGNVISEMGKELLEE